jgi:hypothetical protein
MEKGEGMKAVRFLAPSVDGGYLHAPLMLQAGASGTLYDAELYVNFPKAEFSESGGGGAIRFDSECRRRVIRMRHQSTSCGRVL